jgi:hypothetical protein
MKINFLERGLKKAQIKSFIKIRQVEAELFHANGQTDTTKLTDAFSYFANAPKNMFLIIATCLNPKGSSSNEKF